MKQDLYADYVKITGELRKLDIASTLDDYKKMNAIRLDFIKSFHAICKAPVADKQEQASEDKYDFKK